MTSAFRFSRACWGAIAAALLGLALALVLVAPAGAAPAPTPTTTCDPTYGCTTTTPPPPPPLVCHAQFGGTAPARTATVTEGPPNATAQVVFNGNVLASGPTDAQGHATLTFQLPMGVAGTYQVVVAGVAFHIVCGPGQAWDGGVGGINQGQGNGGAGHNGTGTGSGSSGPLAFTGFHLALWLVIAAALVALGAGLRRAARRRGRFQH